MRILVVGAGASIEEAKRAGAPQEFWPPVIGNFAEKLWDSFHNQFFVYWLPDYLRSLKIDPGPDPTALFIELARNPDSGVNVERLFEYCWINRGDGFRYHQGDWADLINHGILSPLTFLLAQSFYINGQGIRQLEAGKLVAGRLRKGDIVMSLNYDTLFEIALEQTGFQVTYAPNTFNGNGVLVAKPHGSINLLANGESFWFSQPDSIGALPSGEDDFRNHVAIVPPRFNKSYEQHPIAKIIFQSIAQTQPRTLTFWGVGLTDSDVDLIEIYGRWMRSAVAVEVINPDATVASKVSSILARKVNAYASIEAWLSDH